MFRLIACVGLLLSMAGAFAQPKPDSPKLALLVGCTTYPNHPRLRTLYGPANDVKIWRETLTTGFGFPAAGITTLAEWPDDVTKRPTAANIRQAFTALIGQANAGSQIVIVLSGHGMQVPLPKGANPLDPKNFEPDGLDEVFLPADAEKADEDGQIKNAIKDDQFGEWLDALRAKGAHVMIVFDCCHSGTMTRGAEDPKAELREISRVIHPSMVGIKPELIEASVNRAKAAVEAEEKRTGKKVVAPETVKPVDKKGGGSLAAFYAAQPFEEAPELPLPEGAPLARENYYGLLSFSLIQAMKGRQSELNYRELEHAVGAVYRADRGTKGPTPFAEGDLDRQVLGYNVWPNRSSVVLEKNPKGILSVNAGVLAGVTEFSVLAVHPPAGDARPEKTVLGYVQVLKGSATVASAVVAPCGFDGKKAVTAADLPNLGRCEVVARDYGDTRVKLHLDKSAAVAAGYAAIAKIENEGKEVLAMMRVVGTDTEAEWLLRTVTPKEALAEYALKLTGDHVLLIRAAGRQQTDEEKEEELKRVAAGHFRRVFGAYPVGDLTKPKEVKELAEQVARDLPKLFRWQNLWRVSNGTAEERGGSAGKLTLEVIKQPSENAKGPGEAARGGAIPTNTVLDFLVKNDGKQDLWVVAVYLDAMLEISVFDTLPVQRGEKVVLNRATLTNKPGEFGQEGMILLAVPQSIGKPDFKFLQQSALKVPMARSRSDDYAAVPKTPFGELLRTSVVGAGQRALTPVVSTTPLVVSASWVVVP